MLPKWLGGVSLVRLSHDGGFECLILIWCVGIVAKNIWGDGILRPGPDGKVLLTDEQREDLRKHWLDAWA